MPNPYPNPGPTMKEDVRVIGAPTLGAEYEDVPSDDALGARNDDIELALKLPPPMRPPLLAASAASGVPTVVANATASAKAVVPAARPARAHHVAASSSSSRASSLTVARVLARAPREATFDDDVTVIVSARARTAETTRVCLLYTSPSPRDKRQPRMPSSA